MKRNSEIQCVLHVIQLWKYYSSFVCNCHINIAKFIKDQLILKICVRLKLFLFVSVEPLFTHFGEIVNGVDMRGEVALLSRNIKIRGAPATNSKTLGGHIKVHAHI